MDESDKDSEEKVISSSEEEDDDDDDGQEENPSDRISEYEKQRMSRIAENKARMEALGLSKIASSLMGSPRDSTKNIGKRKVVETDEDYRPNYDDDDDHDDNDDDDDDYDEKFVGKSCSGSRKTKAKNKVSESKKKAPSKKNLSSSDYVEDDEDLMKAIALSLQDSVGEGSGKVNSKKKGAVEEKGKGKKKQSQQFSSRLQINEDELIIYFYQFDEAGKGCITIRDLEKMAMGHDFTWTHEELADMIRCFDSDRDGKLSLDDFKKIVTRCRMLKSDDS